MNTDALTRTDDVGLQGGIFEDAWERSNETD